MFDENTKAERGRSNWLIRIGIAVAFVYIGKGKFDGGEWIGIFQQIGLGQWFRYFTGVVEILGGVLVATGVLHDSWRDLRRAGYFLSAPA